MGSRARGNRPCRGRRSMARLRRQSRESATGRREKKEAGRGRAPFGNVLYAGTLTFSTGNLSKNSGGAWKGRCGLCLRAKPAAETGGKFTNDAPAALGQRTARRRGRRACRTCWPAACTPPRGQSDGDALRLAGARGRKSRKCAAHSSHDVQILIRDVLAVGERAKPARFAEFARPGVLPVALLAADLPRRQRRRPVCRRHGLGQRVRG